MSPDSFCISCGHTLVPGARFCGGCGRTLEEPPVAPESKPGPQQQPAREVLRAEPVRAEALAATPKPATLPPPPDPDTVSAEPAHPPAVKPTRRLGGWSIAGLVLLGTLLLLPFPRGLKVLGLLVAAGLLALRFLLRRRAGRWLLGLGTAAALAAGGLYLASEEGALGNLGELGATLESVKERVVPTTSSDRGEVTAPEGFDFSDPAPPGEASPAPHRFEHPSGAFGLEVPEGWSSRATLAGVRLSDRERVVDLARLPDASTEAFLGRLEASVKESGGTVSSLRRSKVRLGGGTREAFHLVGRDPGGRARESYGLLLPLPAGRLLVGTDAEGALEASAREAVHRLAAAVRAGRPG